MPVTLPETIAGSPSVATAPARTVSSSSSSRSWPLPALGGFVTLALAGTLLLWFHYGTAVFFETVRQGFVACFG
jgi:hypothetical protein